jgi:hypothetical protein
MTSHTVGTYTIYLNEYTGPIRGRAGTYEVYITNGNHNSYKIWHRPMITDGDKAREIANSYWTQIKNGARP